MIDVNDLRKGVTFELDNTLYKVLDYEHHKPGRGKATIRVKARNLRTGQPACRATAAAMVRLPTPSGPTNCASGPGKACEAARPANCSHRARRVSPRRSA